MWQVKETSYNIVNLGDYIIVLKDVRAVIRTDAGVKVWFDSNNYIEVPCEGDKKDETYGALWNALTNKGED